MTQVNQGYATTFDNQLKTDKHPYQMTTLNLGWDIIIYHLNLFCSLVDIT